MRLDQLKIDVAAIEGGAWRDAEQLEGVRFKVRGVNNMDYRRLEAKLNGDIPRDERLAGIKPETEDRITGQLLAKTILLGWEGFTDAEGKPVEYTPGFAEELLMNRDYRPLMMSIYATALRLANETALDREEAAKNSAPASAGS